MPLSAGPCEQVACAIQIRPLQHFSSAIAAPNKSPRRTSISTAFGSARTDGLPLELRFPATHLSFLLRASVRHTDARWGYGQAKLRGCVFRVQRRSQTDRSPAWPGIDSTDSSADRPPLTGPQHINIRWKAQGLRFPRPEAQGSRNGSSTDGHDRSLVFLSPFAISRPTPLVPEQQRQHASVVPPI